MQGWLFSSTQSITHPAFPSHWSMQVLQSSWNGGMQGCPPSVQSSAQSTFVPQFLTHDVQSSVKVVMHGRLFSSMQLSWHAVSAPQRARHSLQSSSGQRQALSIRHCE
jgi:hypothetical protein